MFFSPELLWQTSVLNFISVSLVISDDGVEQDVV